MNFIQLGKYKIEVCIIDNSRKIKYNDLKEILELKEVSINQIFVNAEILTNILFNKIYIDKSATIEQKIIYQGLCLVGLFSLIDEACNINLKQVSYIEEFNNLIKDKND